MGREREREREREKERGREYLRERERELKKKGKKRKIKRKKVNIDQERGCYTVSANGRYQCRLSAPTVIDRCRQNVIFIILACWYLETVDGKLSAQSCWYRQETDNKTKERNEKDRKKRKS